MDGLETLKQLKERLPEVPVIMLSGHGQARSIVEAMKLGAADFLRKPFEVEELEVAFQKALEKRALKQEVEELRGRVRSEAELLMLCGDDPKMREVREIIEQVADTDITVLVRGESGTGKELVARALHRLSGRVDRPFVKVNCAALPSELLESELFGFEKGAFTGAQRRKLGKFEYANHGTIFLDEISEMHPALQAKLLQVLQDGEFSRLGGESDVHVDTRVIAATNRNLETAVAEGSFREDLFYRLNVVTVQLPPLRERKDAIPLLVDHFLTMYNRQYGKSVKQLQPRTLEACHAYQWPGNVRELENTVKRMVVLGNEQAILEEITHRTSLAGDARTRPSSVFDLEALGVDFADGKRRGSQGNRQTCRPDCREEGDRAGAGPDALESQGGGRALADQLQGPALQNEGKRPQRGELRPRRGFEMTLRRNDRRTRAARLRLFRRSGGSGQRWRVRTARRPRPRPGRWTAPTT